MALALYAAHNAVLNTVDLIKTFHKSTGHIMGNSNDYAGQREQILHHLLAGFRVKAGSNLIGDDEVIPTKYQPGDADALALTARKIFTVFADESVQSIR